MEIIARLANLPGALPGACAQGLIWGIMAIGVYLTYRILDVADLTVDGSFGTGGAVCVMCLLSGMNVWLSLLLAFSTLTGCAGQISIIGGEDGPTAIITSDSASAVSVTEDGQYDSKDEVAAYLTEYGHLPSNYITKKQAQALGWQGGSLEPYAPGCSIGGDRFGNYEGTLPDGSYHECDLNTRGADKRGAERLVYADDGRIYYTADHYESFEEITE